MSQPDNIVPFPAVAEIEEQAAAWVARAAVRPLSHSDQALFDQWLASSAQHREIWERMVQIYGALDVLDDLNYVEHHPEAVRAVARRHWLRRAALACAASMLLAVSVLQLWRDAPPAPVLQAAEFATAVGEQQTTLLVDGSSIVLDTDSTLLVALEADERRVDLMRGQAFFAIASDAARPFRVYADGRTIQAVGTAFSVQLRDGKVSVVVTEGTVQIFAAAAADTESPLAALTEGQQAVFAERVEQLEQIGAAELRQRLSWRDGFLVFSGDPLERVVAEISRYTTQQISIPDASLRALVVGGYFRVGDVDGLLEALDRGFDVAAERVDADSIRLSRRQ
jgi:transmembrane sensor